MVVRHGCSCRISTSGRAPSGCGACASWKRTSAASGSRWDITTTATPGKSRDMTEIDAGGSHRRRLEWQPAMVRDVVVETPRVKTLLLQVRSWKGHLPDQHVDIRLTAEDGYQAQRSYSLASPPEDQILALTVERVRDGEVSPYLVDHPRIGDQF